jgi:hypothetical protein
MKNINLNSQLVIRPAFEEVGDNLMMNNVLFNKPSELHQFQGK